MLRKALWRETSGGKLRASPHEVWHTIDAAIEWKPCDSIGQMRSTGIAILPDTISQIAGGHLVATARKRIVAGVIVVTVVRALAKSVVNAQIFARCQNR